MIWKHTPKISEQNIGPLFYRTNSADEGHNKSIFRIWLDQTEHPPEKKQWILVEVLQNPDMYLHKIPQPENPIFWEVFFDKTSPEIAEIPPFLVLEGQTLAGFFGLLSVVQGTGAHRNQHGAWGAQPWDGDDQWVFGGYVNPGLINHSLIVVNSG